MKRKFVFERTITECVTVELDLPEDMSEREIQGWANYGYSGGSPFDFKPDQFPDRTKDQSGWTLRSANRYHRGYRIEHDSGGYRIFGVYDDKPVCSQPSLEFAKHWIDGEKDKENQRERAKLERRT